MYLAQHKARPASLAGVLHGRTDPTMFAGAVRRRSVAGDRRARCEVGVGVRLVVRRRRPRSPLGHGLKVALLADGAGARTEILGDLGAAPQCLLNSSLELVAGRSSAWAEFRNISRKVSIRLEVFLR